MSDHRTLLLQSSAELIEICAGAVIIRNAGGRTFDVLRSLAVLDTIGKPATIVVMHHSGE